MGRLGDGEGRRLGRLTRRDHKRMGSAEVAAHQRARLVEAVGATIGERGYGSVTVTEIVARARVSKSVFYREFKDKREAFGTSVEAALAEGTTRVLAALEASGAGDLRSALAEVASVIAEEPAKARLIFLAPVEVDAAVGRVVREEASLRHRAALGAALGAFKVPDIHLCGLVGGIEEVIYRRLRDEEVERLAEDLPLLADWALEYARTLAGSGSVGARLLEDLGGARTEEKKRDVDPIWDWRADLQDPEVRRRLDQRERIVRATGQVALVKGYAGLSIARISAVAGTSNQTFYEYFANKDAAFIAAFDELALRTFRLTASAIRSDEDALRGALRGVVAMLSHLEEDPIHRRLVFVEFAGAGPEPLARAEAFLDAFVGFIEPAELPSEAGRMPPRSVREAIGGGIWAIIRTEIGAGRGDRLAELAPVIVDFGTIPFGVR
jgi:AcrR family transcriptional regulator